MVRWAKIKPHATLRRTEAGKTGGSATESAGETKWNVVGHRRCHPIPGSGSPSECECLSVRSSGGSGRSKWRRALQSAWIRRQLELGHHRRHPMPFVSLHNTNADYVAGPLTASNGRFRPIVKRFNALLNQRTFFSGEKVRGPLSTGTPAIGRSARSSAHPARRSRRSGGTERSVRPQAR